MYQKGMAKQSLFAKKKYLSHTVSARFDLHAFVNTKKNQPMVICIDFR